MKELKGSSNGNDLPMLNNNAASGQYLYFGRSHKLRNRIRQHLGAGHKGTYAMHMKRWCGELKEIIELHYCKIEGYNNCFVQAIEDAL